VLHGHSLPPKLTKRRGIFAASEASAAGIHPQKLARLVKRGTVERVSRGKYRLAGAEVTEHHGLALAAASVPKGVACLLSALRFHDVTTQNPFEVWFAIERRSRAPKLEYPPLRILRFSGRAFSSGVETHVIEGGRVRVYSLAKTIADLFKYRNKVGVDVAVEALRESWQSRRIRLSEIDPYARICRVQRVMRPYVEALIG
jgi:predicted transcriptional regulator of viral defense system